MVENRPFPTVSQSAAFGDTRSHASGRYSRQSTGQDAVSVTRLTDIGWIDSHRPSSINPRR